MLDQNYNMLVPWYVMSLIYPLQSNIILFALCRLGKYVNKTFTFPFFLFCSWKSLCLRFLFPEAIPPSLSTLALPTWARRLGMVKKASKVMIKGKYLGPDHLCSLSTINVIEKLKWRKTMSNHFWDHLQSIQRFSTVLHQIIEQN